MRKRVNSNLLLSLLQIGDGFIQYNYGNTTVRIIETQVNDGKWHHVEVKWMKGEVWVNLDYGDHEITQRSDDQIVGLYIDKISVGGVEPSDGSNVKHFIGCIKVLF